MRDIAHPRHRFLPACPSNFPACSAFPPTTLNSESREDSETTHCNLTCVGVVNADRDTAANRPPCTAPCMHGCSAAGPATAFHSIPSSSPWTAEQNGPHVAHATPSGRTPRGGRRRYWPSSGVVSRTSADLQTVPNFQGSMSRQTIGKYSLL